jgi:DNA-binding transcriptional LysR family regulator
VSVELRELRYFVAVAEELNFTRAGERVNIAQQALSRSIRQLEERVGAELVLRTTRRVELTSAGAALLESSRPLLAAVDEAVASARHAAVEERTLTVGFVASVTHAQMGEALRRFGELRPDVTLRIHFGDLIDPAGGLRGGEVDAAAVHGPFDTTGLELEYLWSDPMGALMAADHPLAAREEVSLAELLDQPCFDFPTPDARWRDYWMLAEYRNGRPPRIAAQFRTLDALLSVAGAGLGVDMAPSTLLDLVGPDSRVAWRPVPELPPLRHYIARRAGDEREELLELVEICHDAFSLPQQVFDE